MAAINLIKEIKNRTADFPVVIVCKCLQIKSIHQLLRIGAMPNLLKIQESSLIPSLIKI